MQYPDARIIIFAKPPIAGKCKTRLIPAIGEQAAAELQAQLAWRTLATTTQSELCPVELWCADTLGHPFFKQCQKHFPISLKQQQGTDLGQRMAHAIGETLSHCQRALIIGTDCPSLESRDLQEALEALDQHDCVLKPAEDGGYVLIGLNKMNPAIFEAIDWGSSKVLQQTRTQLQRQQMTWQELATTWDLDHPEDLDKLSPSLLNNIHQMPLINA